MNKLPLLLGIPLAAFVLLFVLGGFQTNKVMGSAPSGLSATMATSSTLTVGPQQKMTLFASADYCNSRIITTVASPIMISFNALSSTTISGTVGHLQAASTTVAYDSGIYGCGLLTAFGFSSSTITVSAF